MIRLIDITPPLTAASPVFPGDEPFSLTLAESVIQSGVANVSVVTSSLHNGAHADAPLHLFAQGADIASMPVERFIGPCFVAEVCSEKRFPVALEEVSVGFFKADGRARCERLLLKTRSSRPSVWSDDFRALSAAFVQGVADAGVRLIGVDVPSIDPAESTSLPAHRAALSRSIPILENLDLTAVESGFYELIALPMNWPGAEASPVRAVLRPLATSLSIDNAASAAVEEK